MIQLSTDASFHFELLRALNVASYGGADILEVFHTADEMVAGNFESFYAAFNKRAERIVKQVEQMKNPVSIKDALFRAANYYRFADFYIHGKWDDPRITELWDKQMRYFDRAISLSPNPGKRNLIPTSSGFQIPILFFSTSKDANDKRPTIVMANGFDGSMEEIYHVHGIAALERDFNVIIYEGPGQQYVRRSQGYGFISEWENVITPLLDHVEALPGVDSTKIALLGYSLGGFLAARAAAFEHRLAALVLMDGMYDLSQLALISQIKEFLKHTIHPNMDDEAVYNVLQDSNSGPTTFRWLITHGMWAFNTKSPFEVLERFANFSIADIADKIECPVMVCDPTNDHLSAGQPKLVAEALGGKATHVIFSTDDAAEEHCHIGASRFANQVMYDWLEEKLQEK